MAPTEEEDSSSSEDESECVHNLFAGLLAVHTSLYLEAIIGYIYIAYTVLLHCTCTEMNNISQLHLSFEHAAAKCKIISN